MGRGQALRHYTQNPAISLDLLVASIFEVFLFLLGIACDPIRVQKENFKYWIFTECTNLRANASESYLYVYHWTNSKEEDNNVQCGDMVLYPT